MDRNKYNNVMWIIRIFMLVAMLVLFFYGIIAKELWAAITGGVLILIAHPLMDARL
tara:strand:- start:466 stop:633 length:168 start_codon:yes stop_codon:yes gene_type:complete